MRVTPATPRRILHPIHFLILLAPPVCAGEPLHPVGDFDALPVWPQEKAAKVYELSTRSPADATARQAQFVTRNNAAGLKALCLKLHAAMEPDAPQLAGFREHVVRGDYRKALDSYRAYFFAKVKDPEAFGAYTQNLTGYQLKARKDWVLKRVEPEFIDLAMQGVYSFKDARARVGMPGSIAWVPHTLELPEGATYTRSANDHPFWRTDAGAATRREIEFYPALNKFPTEHMPLPMRLLQSYILTGNREHLKRCCEIFDDWAMNAARDIDAFPIDIRSATELESERLRDFPGMMRVMVDERPEIAERFDSATLARLVLHALNDFIPYTIRAKRTELANWGIMGIGNALHFATLFHEFHSMTYARRELWRLWNINFTQYFALDGAGLEAADTGHGRIAVPRARECMPYALLPDVAGPLQREAFNDLLRDRMRYVTVQMTPRGRQHPRFDSKYVRHPRYDWLEPKWTTFDKVSAMRELLWDRDAELRRRLTTVMHNVGKDVAVEGSPEARSDVAPYAAMYFLRDSWGADAEHFRLYDYKGASVALAMRSVPLKSVVFGRESGRFDLAMNGSHLVVGGGIVVDRKPGNFFHGQLRTGGKTIYCMTPRRNVVGNRFYTSETFDFAESAQLNPHYRPPEGVRKDGHLFNLYSVIPELDNTPVDDVKTYRQVFALRGEGVYFINTRIENSGNRAHEYSQFFALPTWAPAKRPEQAQAAVKQLREAGHELLVEDGEAGLIATSNVGRDNVSIHLSGNLPFEYGNIIGRKGEHESIGSPLEAMESNLERYIERRVTGRNFEQRWLSHQLYPVSVRWTGEGNQVFLVVLATRPASSDEASSPLACGPRSYKKTQGRNGVLGCAVTTRNGTPAWFQSGPQRQNSLTAGPVTTTAEAVVAMQKNGVISGMVIGATALGINGKSYDLKTSDVAFSLNAAGVFNSSPIRRPIDTVQISPAQTVFIEHARVSFDIPTQDTGDVEFRYTLDGSDPTPASSLYTGPFELKKTATVKVRPFRKGLKSSPWDFPGIDAGKTIGAVFTKVDRSPAQVEGDLQDGLNYGYMEGDWPTLMMQAGRGNFCPVSRRGTVSALLSEDETNEIRRTKGAYAIRYSGYIDVPQDGVYIWYAPAHMLDVSMDAGFDLRLWIDGKEWFPEPGLHAQNSWSVALGKGLHSFEVSFVDFRMRPFKNEFWLAWREKQVWQGMPVVEVSGPGVKKQPLPRSWLKRKR